MQPITNQQEANEMRRVYKKLSTMMDDPENDGRSWDSCMCRALMSWDSGKPPHFEIMSWKTFDNITRSVDKQFEEKGEQDG